MTARPKPTHYRVTLVIDIDAGCMDLSETFDFIKSPEGAHYSVDHGQLVSSKVEVRDAEAH